MSRHDTHKPASQGVDWDHPDLKALLSKTEAWSLDNRNPRPPEEVQLHVGWAASTGRPATLVWEHEQAWVLETRFSLEPGEPVRVDRYRGGLRSAWGTVLDGRPGQRADDAEHGLHVYWLHMK